MQYKRSKRVGELILREISNMLIMGEIKDPRIGFITLTRISLSDDLQDAKIYVSILGEERDKAESLDGLNSAKSFIRRELGKRLRIKHIPAIRFLLDKSIEYSIHINSILEKTNKEV